MAWITSQKLGVSPEVRCSWRLAFLLNPSFSALSVHLYMFQHFHTHTWFYEKLRLLKPPRNIAQYRAKHCHTRRLYLIPEDVRNWLSTFPDTLIQWMCPWWRLQHMTIRSYTYFVPIAGLHSSTFYNPGQFCRQFGQKQLIMGLVHEFGLGPLS